MYICTCTCMYTYVPQKTHLYIYYVIICMVHTYTGIYILVMYVYISALLYVAWADQRHRQCCIRHTEQILNGTVLYDGGQGEGGRTFAFSRFGELTSA